MSSEPRRQAPAAEPPAEPVSITDPIVMRALAHPVRTALFELLSVVETLTASEASELLGESPANCAFHLRTLAKYGFAEEAGGGRGRERPWKAVNRSISISTKQDDPQAAMAADALSRMWFEQWVERARATYSSRSMLPGWEHASGWQRSAVYLTPDETQDLTRDIQQLLRKYESRREHPAERPPGAVPVEWTVFKAPIVELAERASDEAREVSGRAAGQDPARPRRRARRRPATPDN